MILLCFTKLWALGGQITVGYVNDQKHLHNNKTHRIYVYTCKYNTSNQQSTAFLTRALLILIILFWCYCTLFRCVFMNMFIMYSVFFHDHPTPSYCKVVDYYYVQEYTSSEYINIRVYLLLLCKCFRNHFFTTMLRQTM